MKIIAIGHNYREHNRELDSDNPAEPVVFLKPDTALLLHNRPFYIPDFTGELHYETELLVRIFQRSAASSSGENTGTTRDKSSGKRA